MLGAKKNKPIKEKKPKKEKVKKEKKPKKEKKKKEKRPKKEEKPKKDKSEKTGKSKKKLIIIGLLVIALLFGAGFAAYTFVFKDGKHEDSKKDAHTKTEQSADSKEKKPDSKDAEGTTESAVDANPIGEISYANYLRISLGDSYKNVVRLLGEEGKEIATTQVDGLDMKEYSFGDSNEITVAFVNDQMVKKSKTGLKEEINPEPTKQTEEKKTEKK